jgi:hypothetical protein
MSSTFSTPNWFKDRARQGRALFETARLVVTSSFYPADGAATDLSPQGKITRLPFRERNEEPANITYTQSLPEDQSLPEEPAWISGKHQEAVATVSVPLRTVRRRHRFPP